ncbi:MAG: carboxymuconolactone decarboxylase family protein [Nonomuraea sp.]|nr:carboxymuconolactone decarboxylase family protein [Nonomuraea sp.]NUP61383.1 carboxymuconolactone decarboxylase family protein [Nonomuraea sp.]NUR83956.1 carboxymuconolactone decarboxylase family protein [Nonomuraea sp.]NUS05874.1 carboxymuconolactone decarboxylase family protein [Nonomuraea sp.]NUT12852.1 carboxymuconolactone decarboxylase family protein [Nonomuraea sp.]
MTERMDLGALAGEAYKAMAGLDRFVAHSTLPKPLLELVRLRASQINGCVYCVDMHSSDAKQAGESDARLHAVAVWREAPFFTAQERAALAFTEAATRLSTDDVTDEVWAEAAAHFDEPQLAALVVAVATINAWNRMGVATRMTPESYKA